jgi:hypothetical protein
MVASLLLPAGAAGRAAVTINPVITGTLGANGWYVSNVTVNWTFDPPPSQTQGCETVTISAAGTTNLLCSAWWGLVHIDYPLAISVDKTAPSVHGVPSRQPDNGNASVSGTCTDRAGNVGQATYGFSYDSTPPTLGNVSVKHGNRNVLLSWSASADTQLIQITRSQGSKGPGKVLFRGKGTSFRDKGLRPGVKYQYTVSAFDVAANASSKTVPVTATGALIDPVPGERVTSPPRLVWLPVKGASYYNVQLIRDGRVLSAWPRRAQLKLQRSWIYKGHRYRLRPGVYRWYVWPGFGRLARAHYGRRLGGSAFVYAG